MGAVVVGLGSILGTGVFAIVGLGASMTGTAVLLAIILGAGLAVCNGFNSAQLAAKFPVSGGTYEYGYRLLNADLGFTAGWMFLLAKSASAATAALTIALYLQGRAESNLFTILIALAVLGAMTVLVSRGIRRTQRMNTLIVGVTVLALGLFSVVGIGRWLAGHGSLPEPFFIAGGEQGNVMSAFLQTCALVFVGYTGYGRIATMGEEISNPQQNIPRAMKWTLGVSALIYIGVALAYLTQQGTGARFELNTVAANMGTPGLYQLVTIGALTAMLGVLLNLLLGLSRMLYAMGKRGDMPRQTGQLSQNNQPRVAVFAVGALAMLLSLIGDIKLAWSFSAFTVLLYYAICNASALRLPRNDKLFPDLYAWCGLGGCLFLAFWVPWVVWLSGLGLIAAGLLWRHYWQTRRSV